MKRKIDTMKIKKLMLENGFETNASLSDKTGINRVTLGKILKGEQLPSSESIYRIVEALHISASEAGNIFFADNLRSE